MRPDVVVENFELIERALKRTTTWDDELPEQRLERAKQALDPAVLPRGVFLGGLVLDAREFEKGVEQPTVQNRLVVGAQFAGLAVLGNGQAQMPQHAPAAPPGEHLQAQSHA